MHTQTNEKEEKMRKNSVILNNKWFPFRKLDRIERSGFTADIHILTYFLNKYTQKKMHHLFDICRIFI